MSAADEQKLPPGGFMLREGFPQWFQDATKQGDGENNNEEAGQRQPPHIAQVLHYLRIAFSVPELLDGIPLASAANPSAWHAWRSYRAKTLGERARSPPLKNTEGSDGGSERSLSPRTALTQQPGGARRPGEWNWTGVWEERVRKVVVGSRGEGALFGGDNTDVVGLHARQTHIMSARALPRILSKSLLTRTQIGFAKMDDEALKSILPQMEAQVSI